MVALTKISWTDFSSNPLKYRDLETDRDQWACVHADIDCRGCYAEDLARHYRRGRPFSHQNIGKVEPYLSAKELRALARYGPLSGHTCFIGDMTDVAGDWVPDALLAQLFGVLAKRQDATFQVLTKRPRRMARLFTDAAFVEQVTDGGRLPWPLRNVWLGTSVGYGGAVGRIDALREIPAAVRFLSIEPLIGAIGTVDLTGIDWSIIGGQSGSTFRPMELDWLTEVVDHCRAVGVAIWVKQDCGRYPGRQGRIPDEYWLHQWPTTRPTMPEGGAGDDERATGGGRRR